MRVLGVYGGIGSMLVAARNVGCEVVGNIEPRDFEDGRTFRHNFPEAFFSKDLKVATERLDIDLIVGHPSCGSYSRINWRESKVERDEVEKYIEVVKTLKPKYWVMDNLPKMFSDYTADFWCLQLGGYYDISPVFVNNHNYGNAQVRKRVYLIGSLKGLDYVPVPDEAEYTTTTKDIIGHLFGSEGLWDNHVDVNHEDKWSSMTNVLKPNTKSSYREMYTHVEEYPEGRSFKYFKADGEEGTRIGLTKVRWEGHCSTLSSTARQIHPLRCTPLTIKEQLLLMGYPEEFKLIGQKVNDDGSWKIRGQEYHQVNKGVCIESVSHFIGQIMLFDKHGDSAYNGLSRLEESSDQDVNTFKFSYCQKPGVTINKRKCQICKMQGVCRKRSL